MPLASTAGMPLKAPVSPHPLDILGSGPRHSATFSTFVLSLSFFESFVLRQLRAAGCNDITVFVDPLGYQNSLIESQLIGVGASYRLLPVSAGSGAFHLKFCFLEAESEHDPDCLLVGSGNLTFGGYGNNAELLDVFLSSEQPGIFRAFAGVVDRLAVMPGNSPAIGTAFRGLRQRVTSPVADLAVDSATRLAFCLETPIGQTIAIEARRLGACRDITILSPYFESLKAVEDLWTALGKTLKRFQDTLSKIIDDKKRCDKDRRTAAVWLVDMSLFVFQQRKEQGESEVYKFCRSWLALAVERFSKGIDTLPDELDRAFVTLSAALMPTLELEAGQGRPLAAGLQRYFGGVLDRQRLGNYLREADTLGTEALEVSSIDVLQESLDRLCATETSWQIARRALAKLKKGTALEEIPQHWLDENSRDQAAIIDALSSSRVRQQPQRYVTEATDAKVDACPRCNRNLPRHQKHLINYWHIALCSNCGQLLFKTTP